MSTHSATTATANGNHDRPYGNGPSGAENRNGTQTQDFEKLTQGMSHEEKQVALQASRFGYGPLAHVRTNDSTGGMLPGQFS